MLMGEVVKRGSGKLIDGNRMFYEEGVCIEG